MAFDIVLIIWLINYLKTEIKEDLVGQTGGDLLFPR